MRRLIISLGFFASVAALFADPSVDEIITRALGQDQRMREYRATLEYDLRVEETKLNRDNKEKGTKEATATILPGGALAYTVSVDLGVGSEQAAPTEEEKKRLKDSQKYMAVMDFQKLIPRFLVSLSGREKVLQRDCYILSFTPKGSFPAESLEDRVVNEMSGKFWVDTETFSVLKAEGALGKPVTLTWLIATMRDLKFQYTAGPLPNRDFGPAKFELLFDVNTLLTYKRRRQISTMTGYRVFSGKAIEVPAKPKNTLTAPHHDDR